MTFTLILHNLKPHKITNRVLPLALQLCAVRSLFHRLKELRTERRTQF